jgi:hemolysin III
MQGTIGGTALTIGWLIFIIQWSLIIVGITFKSIWLKKLHWIHLIIFLALGWTAVFFINNIFTTNLTFFLLILFGGISYTIGVVFYILSGKVKYFHFVWHLFVNIGCILHGLAIILFLY